MSDIVITGMGAITPLADNCQKLWEALVLKESALKPFVEFNTEGFLFHVGGEVPSEWLKEEGSLSEDKAVQLLLKAFNEASVQSELQDGNECGFVLGSNFFSVKDYEEGLVNETSPLTNFDPIQIIQSLNQDYKFNGVSSMLSLSCSSGLSSMSYAFDLLKSGQAKRLAAGGFDCLSRFCWSGLGGLRTMSEEGLKPFDENRKGTQFAEGAGIVILETKEEAEKRGVEILGEMCSYGANNNAYHMSAPVKDGSGLRKAMEMAVERSDVNLESIVHINAHATGTPYNDSSETQAIRDLFKEHTDNVVIGANKANFGHLMGAAGSVEAIITLMSLNNQIVPPIACSTEIDPEILLQLSFESTLSLDGDYALTNSSGIGGNNASVLLKRGVR